MKNHKLSVFFGLENFKHRDIINGCTQYIDDLYQRCGSLQIFENDYKYHWRLNNDIKYTTVETAEMIKYASNSFLALKISFVNEIANLCESVGADVHNVATAMGQDGRISDKFLHPGPGFGGSCFPKDLEALLSISEYNNVKITNNNQEAVKNADIVIFTVQPIQIDGIL